MTEKPGKPEVFAVEKGVSGWQFSRRGFITLAGASTVGAALACGRAAEDENMSDLDMRQTDTAATVVASFSQTAGDVDAAPVAPVDIPAGDELIQRLEACQGIIAHNSEIWWVETSGDSRVLLTSPSEGGDKLWKLPGGELALALGEDQHAYFAPYQDALLLDLGSGRVEIYDTGELDRLGTLTGRPLGGADDIFSPDGSLFALVDESVITIYSLSSREVFSTFTVADTPESLAISPNLDLVAVGLASGDIQVFSLPDAAELVTIDAHTAPVKQISIGLGGIRMASFDEEHPVVKFWSLPDGRMISEMMAGDGLIWFGELLAGDQMLLTWHDDLRKRLWRLADGTLVREYMDEEDQLYTSNGSRLITTSEGDKFHVISLPDMEEILTIDKPAGASPWPAAVSHDESMLAFVVDDMVVEVHAISDGTFIGNIVDAPSSVDVVQFSSDSSMLITAHSGGAVRVYTPNGDFVSCLVDIDEIPQETDLNQYTTTTETGETITYTLPCGADIPAGAICTCNCVGGGGGCSCVGYVTCSCVSHVSGGGSHYWFPN